MASVTATLPQLSRQPRHHLVARLARSSRRYARCLQAITGRVLRALPVNGFEGHQWASAPSHPKANPDATLGLVLNVLSVGERGWKFSRPLWTASGHRNGSRTWRSRRVRQRIADEADICFPREGRFHDVELPANCLARDFHPTKIQSRAGLLQKMVIAGEEPPVAIS